MGHPLQNRHKRHQPVAFAYGWLFLLLLAPFCPVVVAAPKSLACSLPVCTSGSSEYGAFLKLARFAPSEDQKKGIESLFSQLKERHITIKPTFYTLLALADSDQLLPLCQKTAHFFFHVDNTRIKNSDCFSDMVRRKKHVRAVIAQGDGDIAMLAASPCLPAVTGLCHNRGVPDAGAVASLLAWPVWQVGGEFDHEIFRAVCAMFTGRGFPEQCDVANCMVWLSGAGGVDRETLQLMSRLFQSLNNKALGMPPVELLRDYEQLLLQLLGVTASDVQSALKTKQVALFLANRDGANYLSWAACERFLKVYAGQLHGNGVEAAPSRAAQALSRLHAVLLTQGGPGIRTFFAVNDSQNWATSVAERDQQLARLSLPVPLKLISSAFDHLPPDLWREYIFFGRKRATPPDRAQWHEIRDWRRVLPERMSNPCRQRSFIDIAVTLPQSCKTRLMNREAIEALITLFPSVKTLLTISSHGTPAHIAQLICAALDYIQQKRYDAETLTTLLPALLQAGLTLPGYTPEALPPSTFMHRAPCNGGITIHCPATDTTGEQLLHSFVATFTGLARDMFMVFKDEHFTIAQYDGKRFRFAVPQCAVGPHSMTIRNWTPEDFKLFFDLTWIREIGSGDDSPE